MLSKQQGLPNTATKIRTKQTRNYASQHCHEILDSPTGSRVKLAFFPRDANDCAGSREKSQSFSPAWMLGNRTSLPPPCSPHPRPPLPYLPLPDTLVPADKNLAKTQGCLRNAHETESSRRIVAGRNSRSFHGVEGAARQEQHQHQHRQQMAIGFFPCPRFIPQIE